MPPSAARCRRGLARCQKVNKLPRSRLRFDGYESEDSIVMLHRVLRITPRTSYTAISIKIVHEKLVHPDKP